MLNAEKYKDKLENLEKRSLVCFIAKEKVGLRCDLGYCLKCEKEAFKWLLEEYKEPINPILTEKEKIIINNILKAIEPFGVEVQCIAKYRQGDEPTDYYLNFSYKNSTDDFDTFPFNGNELFVGMKVDELYTLEELGL